jgi:hypothetical protein
MAAGDQGKKTLEEELVEMASDDFNEALRLAVGGGHPEAMRPLKEWDTDDYDFNEALYHAAKAGQMDAMYSLKNWGGH